MTAFATPAELASAMGLPAFTGDSLVRATSMLDYASALIRIACSGQVLEEVEGAQEEFAADDTVRTLFLTQRPVIAVTELLIDLVEFTDYEWSRTGTIVRNDGDAWWDGPIRVTYDHGYEAGSDEMVMLTSVAVEVAARAITKETEPFATMGESVVEFRGGPPQLFLTPQEMDKLASYGAVPVG